MHMRLYKIVNYQYMDRILVNIFWGRNNTSAVALPPVPARSCFTLVSNYHRLFDPSLSQREMACQDGFLNTFAKCKLGRKPCLACRLRLSKHGGSHFAPNLPCLAEYSLYRTTSVLSSLCPYRSQANC